MQNYKEYIIDRYTEFWYDIYNIEKNEIRKLKDYIDYIKENIKLPFNTTNKEKIIEEMFLRKHLEYIDEAFSSLIIGNANAFAVLARIMIENYVSFCLIKKYRQKKLWRDWYLWSQLKMIRKLENSTSYNKTLELYNQLCSEFNLPKDHIKNTYNYGWLEHVSAKCNFKAACKLLEPNESTKIYSDFEYLSEYIHNNDFYSKSRWIDMHSLIKFIDIFYNYINLFIYKYQYHITTKKEYQSLSYKLYEAINETLNYKEDTPVS